MSADPMTVALSLVEPAIAQMESNPFGVEEVIAELLLRIEVLEARERNLVFVHSVASHRYQGESTSSSSSPDKIKETTAAAIVTEECARPSRDEAGVSTDALPEGPTWDDLDRLQLLVTAETEDKLAWQETAEGWRIQCDSERRRGKVLEEELEEMRALSGFKDTMLPAVLAAQKQLRRITAIAMQRRASTSSAVSSEGSSP